VNAPLLVRAFKMEGHVFVMTEAQYSHSEGAADSGQPNNDIWRNEVHSRLARFRSRRGRRLEGAYSMRFPFPPAEPVADTSAIGAALPSSELNIAVAEVASPTAIDSGPQAPSTDVVATFSPELTVKAMSDEDPAELTSPSCALETVPEVTPESNEAVVEALLEGGAPPPITAAELEPEPVVRSRPRPKRKVIAFPRQSEAGNAHRLADPVLLEQPRILDVPEELEAYPTTPFLEGLQFGPATQASAPADHVELPFRAAGIPYRIYAALVDVSLVLVAAILFAAIAHKMLPDLTLNKPTRLTAALLPVLLWAIFQYLFLVYAGRTAGMRLAGLRMRSFDGRATTPRRRRSRVLGLYLSTASLIMGLLWAFVDIDTLCWHDRISGTYLTRQD
jgi:uncharacterized RDD family membrane protein YckC